MEILNKITSTAILFLVISVVTGMFLTISDYDERTYKLVGVTYKVMAVTTTIIILRVIIDIWFS